MAVLLEGGTVLAAAQVRQCQAKFPEGSQPDVVNQARRPEQPQSEPNWLHLLLVQWLVLGARLLLQTLCKDCGGPAWCQTAPHEHRVWGSLPQHTCVCLFQIQILELIGLYSTCAKQ